MPEPITLNQVWAAFVNQATLEDAADWMAAVARDNEVVRAEIFDCLGSAATGESEREGLVAAVNRSGYKVGSVQEARDMCAELLGLFTERLNHLDSKGR